MKKSIITYVVVIALIVLLAFRKYTKDRALWRRVKRNVPQAGAAGRFIVLSAGSRRLPAGTELRVPFEGTLGGSMSCDVCVPYKKVHMRSALAAPSPCSASVWIRWAIPRQL